LRQKFIGFGGNAGSGKTSSVYTYAKNHCMDIYEYPYEKNGWWDSYDQQEIVLFDDFAKDAIDFRFLLRLADRHPITVPIRGKAPVPFLSKLIFITCDRSPQKMYNLYGDKNILKQLLRRIETIEELNVKSDEEMFESEDSDEEEEKE